ncbi:MAG: hypothetical protein AAF660_04860 [Pseudomonadota bacterium]
MRLKGLVRFYRLEADLSDREVDRLQSAARFAGIPWASTVARPKAAKQFMQRIEKEYVTTQSAEEEWCAREDSNL